jgi:tetratricopeptide (TPR) repeat protein
MRELATDLAFRRGEGEKAVAWMEAVWDLTRRSNEAGNLIYFYSATGQLQEALEVFETVAENHHHPRVYATVGAACVEAGDWGRAEQTLMAAVDAAKDDLLRAEVQIHLARVWFALGKTEEAQRALEGGLALDLAQRGGLAQGKMSAFWRPWTRWLGEALEELEPRDARVKPLLRAVRKELGELAS